jgi:hypothetical protein
MFYLHKGVYANIVAFVMNIIQLEYCRIRYVDVLEWDCRVVLLQQDFLAMVEVWLILT